MCKVARGYFTDSGLRSCQPGARGPFLAQELVRWWVKVVD